MSPLICAAVLALGGCPSGGGPAVVGSDTEPATEADWPSPSDAVGPDLPYSYATTCRLPPETPAAQGVRLVEAFGNLPSGTFRQPLALTHAGDGTGRLFVAERAGRIKVFANTPEVASARTFLDLSHKVYTGFECGFMGLAFDPAYATNGHLYTHYCVRAGPQTWSLVSRWTVSASDPDLVDPASEVELLRLEQPWDNHNGGDLAFGPDGMLYISFGDGGSSNDPLNSGQDTNTWLGAILRIDVRGVSAIQGYAVPPDNPFAMGGGRPEIFAWGLRNPWRISFDRLTGALWTGDVGQNAVEEVNVVERGKNYGWNIMEGSRCRPGGPSECDATGLTPPVAEYTHDVGRSITGGFVYRGTRVPALYGAYLYADFVTNVVFAFRLGQEPPPSEPLLVAPAGVASFGEDAAGEVYLLGLANGAIYRFDTESAGDTPEAFPQTLAETGCFTSVADLSPATGVLPYALNLPFWSDGADKDRFVVLPPSGRMTYRAEGPWQVPSGTIFIKHFELAGTRLETRFLVKDDDGVRGYTYRWSDDGTSARLLTGADTRTLPGEGRTWRFPSRQQCSACHTSVSGGVLGLEIAQLNRDVSHPELVGGAPINQIEALRAWGLVQDAPASVSGLPRFVAPGATGGDDGAQARAWLHVNCANCHQPAGPSGTDLDLRHTTPLAGMRACDVPPQRNDLGVADARIIAPGDPGRSVLQRRLTSDEPHRMPPISTEGIDEAGVALIARWIEGLARCE